MSSFEPKIALIRSNSSTSSLNDGGSVDSTSLSVGTHIIQTGNTDSQIETIEPFQSASSSPSFAQPRKMKAKLKNVKNDDEGSCSSESELLLPSVQHCSSSTLSSSSLDSASKTKNSHLALKASVSLEKNLNSIKTNKFRQQKEVIKSAIDQIQILLRVNQDKELQIKKTIKQQKKEIQKIEELWEAHWKALSIWALLLNQDNCRNEYLFMREEYKQKISYLRQNLSDSLINLKMHKKEQQSLSNNQKDLHSQLLDLTNKRKLEIAEKVKLELKIEGIRIKPMWDISRGFSSVPICLPFGNNRDKRHRFHFLMSMKSTNSLLISPDLELFADIQHQLTIQFAKLVELENKKRALLKILLRQCASKEQQTNRLLDIGQLKKQIIKAESKLQALYEQGLGLLDMAELKLINRISVIEPRALSLNFDRQNNLKALQQTIMESHSSLQGLKQAEKDFLQALDADALNPHSKPQIQENKKKISKLEVTQKANIFKAKALMVKAEQEDRKAQNQNEQMSSLLTAEPSFLLLNDAEKEDFRAIQEKILISFHQLLDLQAKLRRLCIEFDDLESQLTKQQLAGWNALAVSHTLRKEQKIYRIRSLESELSKRKEEWLNLQTKGDLLYLSKSWERQQKEKSLLASILSVSDKKLTLDQDENKVFMHAKESLVKIASHLSKIDKEIFESRKNLIELQILELRSLQEEAKEETESFLQHLLKQKEQSLLIKRAELRHEFEELLAFANSFLDKSKT